MGLLSRKKVNATPQLPPPISAPLPGTGAGKPASGQTQQQYSRGEYSDNTIEQSKYLQQQQQQAQQQHHQTATGLSLPSPPGSPIEESYSYIKPPTPPHSAQYSRSLETQQQQAHKEVSSTYDQYNSASGMSAPYAGSGLKNDRIGTGSEPGNNYHGQQQSQYHGAHHTNDNRSLESIEMHDGTRDHRQQQYIQQPAGVGHTAQTYPQQHNGYGQHQQTQHSQQNSAARTVGGVRPISAVSNVMSPTPSQASSTSRKTSSRYNLSDFTFIRTLGTGSFGRVHLVRSQHNHRSYAVKVLNKERVVKMKQVEHTNSEREMLERVRHPFLVNLWGTFKDSKNLYMVMDFVAGGELFSLLRKSQRFPDPVAKFFAAEVALALDYLHSLDIIYRDLKPENILLGADGHVKITDFGFAKLVPDITWTLCGTPDYLAPEIVQSRGYNKSVDWYALGVLMFEMLAGYPPFFTEDSNPMRLYEKIIAGKVRYPAYFAPEAKDLLKSLLTPDLTKRYGNLANGSRDIFGHVWFQEVDWERLYRKEIPAPYVPKVEGDWDASNFDQYPEVDLSEYGNVSAPDPHGHLFPLF